MLKISKEKLSFLKSLQYNPSSVTYVDESISKFGKPINFKIYPNYNHINLETDFPISQNEVENNDYSVFQQLSYMLWYTYGLINYNWLTNKSKLNTGESISFFRRSVASGGGLYPGELYVYITGISEMDSGIYYFDVTGPRLVCLRKGNFDQYIHEALNEGGKGIYIFITSFYWKNFFKYLNFSYRLQGLDIGAIVGQVYIMSKIFGFQSTTKYLFNDNALNSLLGIDISEETTYAAVKLEITNKLTYRDNKVVNPITKRNQLDFLKHSYTPPNHLYPEIKELNCLIANDSIFNTGFTNNLVYYREDIDYPYPYDLLYASRNRVSPGENFLFDQLDCEQVRNILDMSLQKNFRVDVPIKEYHSFRFVKLYFYANNVKGLAKGYYFYDQLNQNFILVKRGDFAFNIQRNLTRKNFNLTELPLIIHVASNINYYLKNMNLRGYRAVQMEAGRIMHQIQLNAAGINLGSHPMLSYQGENLERMFDVSENILIQLAIGKFKPLLRLTNDLSQI
ncbi:SagB family peptide dehydrogenase [Bacillus safensis]|uniref:SagB family peptide dehydrogenase n=1 Tax=Bacillus safensis TaxID=561879 RepID=UPI0018E18F47|nr:SagB family peptide dehydrogenase [Bacillus safensis]MBI1630696.1 SagB family peptide dehydrogenase [Bacillus safensis]